jgi:hypothetical protein
MCQVGDRLIPVGVGRIQTPEEAAAEATDVPESRRSRRRQQQQNGNFEQFVGTVNQDLEEVSILLQRNLVSQLTGYELANAYGSDAFIADRSRRTSEERGRGEEEASGGFPCFRRNTRIRHSFGNTSDSWSRSFYN